MRKWTFNAVILIVTLAIASQVKPSNPATTELLVGDGKVSNQPRAGYVFACNSNFRTGGARHTGSWFHGNT
jgi:hypothetical protein